MENARGDRPAKNALFDQFARVGKALASASELGLTTASAHLQTLKAANLVATRRDGTKVYYRLAGIDVGIGSRPDRSR